MLRLASLLGRGSITNITVSLISSSFDSNPLTFTLAGDTRGGPPINYTWTRNGEEITDGGPYSISMAVNGAGKAVYNQSRYRSMLTVTGTLPGLYEYSVTNDATNSMMTSTFNIEGKRHLYCINAGLKLKATADITLTVKLLVAS